eukprot:scaffold15279_cov146-Skeletonema_marinoi.AAC.2
MPNAVIVWMAGIGSAAVSFHRVSLFEMAVSSDACRNHAYNKASQCNVSHLTCMPPSDQTAQSIAHAEAEGREYAVFLSDY